MTRSSRPRKTANLSDSVHHRLSMYALAASATGVGTLALVQPAEARIVYTPAHQTINPLSRTPLDLNHDGTADFTFGGGGVTSYYVFGLYGQQRGNGVREQDRINDDFAAALRAGVRVGTAGQNSHSFMYMAAWHSHGKASSTYTGQWANGGKGVKNRYLGLRFIIKGKTHFGWARLNLTVKKGQDGRFQGFGVLLTGYAYETIPKKPIIAGKTKGPDVLKMPADTAGTLGHLAFGRK